MYIFRLKNLYPCILFLASSSIPAYASDFSFLIFERAEYSDNIGLAENQKNNDTILNTGVRLKYLNDDKKFPTLFELSTSYRDYVNNSFEDQTDVFANLSTKWVMNRNRVEWELVDRYQLLPIDSQLADTPDNQENTNYFSTGPNINVVNTRRSKLALNLRYELFAFEKSNEDRYDALAGLHWTYLLSSNAQTGLHATHRSVKFDDAIANTNYDRNDYFASFEINKNRINFFLEVGQTMVDSENQPGNTSDIIRSKYTHTIARDSVFTLGYNKELSDFGILTATSLPDSSIVTDISSEVFLLEEAFVRFSHIMSWGDLKLAYTWRDYDYEIDDFDKASYIADASLNYLIDKSMTYNISYSYLTTKWPWIERKDKDSVVRLGLSKRFENSFALDLYAQNAKKDSNFANTSYTENRAILEVSYQFK